MRFGFGGCLLFIVWCCSVAIGWFDLVVGVGTRLLF